MNKRIRLADGSEIEAGLTGVSGGKTIMLPTAKKSVFGQEAETLKLWGVDPESGTHFIEGLADRFQVLFFDYEGHLFQHPDPDSLTPERIGSDFLRIADAMNAGSFSYYGYSWLALAGLQLALRTNRLEALIMGGFPPFEGPYREMRIVTDKTHKEAVSNRETASASQNPGDDPKATDWDNVTVTLDPRVTGQFVTMYESLADFDDRKIHDKLNFPKLAFAGEKDTIVYGEKFGNVTVDIAGLMKKNEAVLREFGWDVAILQGNEMDHTKAMQPAAVLPVIKPWLVQNLLSR